MASSSESSVIGRPLSAADFEGLSFGRAAAAGTVIEKERKRERAEDGVTCTIRRRAVSRESVVVTRYLKGPTSRKNACKQSKPNGAGKVAARKSG